MGEHLPMKENRYLLRMEGYRPSKAMVTIEQRYYYLVGDMEAKSELQNGEAEEAWLINSVEPKEYCFPNLWPLFVARHQPWQIENRDKNGRPMPLDFHDLTEWAVGDSLLGVLRMDVDNMKDLFQDGLFNGPPMINPSPDGRKFSYFGRWAALSRQIDLFFKFYMNALCEGKVEDKPFTVSDFDMCDVPEEGLKGRKAVVVYSGGDDLFIIGAWSDVVELAFDIHRSFKAFTGKNPELDLSGGVVAVDEHLPIHLMADLSKRALKRAKENKVPVPRGIGEAELEKGSVALLWSDEIKRKVSDRVESKVIEPVFRWQGWPGEEKAEWASAEDVADLVKLFMNFRKGDKVTSAIPPMDRRIRLFLPRAFLYDLFALIEVYHSRGKLYLARMAHILSRRGPETGGLEKDEKEAIQESWQWLHCRLMNPFTVRYLLPAVTWVELLTRTKSRRGEEHEERKGDEASSATRTQ